MTRALALFLVVAPVATMAGEIFKGTITSTAGAASDNRESGVSGFALGVPNQISVQCTGAPVYVCTDKPRGNCTATTGVLIQSGEVRRTTLGLNAPPATGDAFTSRGVVAVKSSTSATAVCTVFVRSGRE